MNFLERTKATEQLDSIHQSLRRRVKADKKDQQRKSNKTMYKLFGWSFAFRNLLGKETITQTDFKYPEDELSLSHLYDSVQTSIDYSLSKTKTTDSPVNTIFGDYDAIIKKINKQGNFQLYLADVLIMLFFSLGIAMTFLSFKQKPWLGDFNWRYYIYISLFVLIAFMSRFLEMRSLIQGIKLKMKRKIILRIMVYYKLIISDLSFLRGSDNNLIYRLFYWDAEEYTQHIGYVQISGIVFFSVCAIFPIVHAVVQFKTMLHLFAFFMVFTLLVLVPVNYARSKILSSYREIMNEERSTIYELLQNFKSVTHSNLKRHYIRKLKTLNKSKLSVLSVFYRLTFISEVFSTHCLISPMVLATLVVLIFDRKFLMDGGVIDRQHPRSQIMHYHEFVCMMIIHAYAFLRLRRFFSQISSFFRLKTSRLAYHKFFTNDCIVQRAVIRDAALGVGEIDIRDCSVFERYHHRPEYQPLITLFKMDIRRDDGAIDILKKKALSECYSGRDGAVLSDSKYQGSSSGTIVNVIHHLTLKISSGFRVCIYQNKQQSAINGFIKLLIGENITTGGSIRYNGKISFFSKDRMPFLVGKTIRDNILFGEDYDLERYDSILSRMGINFNKYRGRDFFQLAEKASNIKTDDRLNILLARFLYRDSNIYIIEDLFTNINFCIAQDLVERLLKNILQGKTIIYVAKAPELVAMADIVLKFSPGCQYSIKRQAHNGLGANKKDKVEIKDCTKIYTSQGKIKNSIFLENASYEEELAIHKKLQLQKKDVESKINENTNIIEKIAYGIYLTNKRRQEGRNVTQSFKFNYKDLSQFMWRLVTEKGKLRNILLKTTLLSLMSTLPVMAAEHFFMVRIWTDNLEISLNLLHCIVIIVLFLFSLIIWIFKCLWISNAYVKFVSEIHSKIIDNILLGDYNWISRIMFHDILSKTNEQVMSLDIKMFKSVVMLGEIISFLVGSIIILIWAYSALIPLILIVMYVALVYQGLKVLLPTYLKVVVLANYNQSKRDDFMFQLINLIFGHRITGKMQTLNDKFLKLSENVATSERLAFIDFKILLMKVSNFPRMLFSISIMALCIIFLRIDSLNWLGVRKLNYIWTIPVVYRVFTWLEIALGLLIDILGESQKLSRVFEFVEARKKPSPSEETGFFSYRPQTANFRRPIVFKNVSLTLGYKPVLKKINFKVKAMQRVAICGFEGCGRSSIFDLILRAKKSDPKDHSSINLFGVDIEDFNAEEIKREIYLLEREVCMFEGTVRQNIDPYGQHSDEDIVELLLSLGVSKILKDISQIVQHAVKTEEMAELAAVTAKNFKIAIEEVRMSPPRTPKASEASKNVNFSKANKVRPIPKMSNLGVQSASNLELRGKLSITKKVASKLAFKRGLKKDGPRDLLARIVRELPQPRVHTQAIKAKELIADTEITEQKPAETGFKDPESNLFHKISNGSKKESSRSKREIMQVKIRMEESKARNRRSS